MPEPPARRRYATLVLAIVAAAMTWGATIVADRVLGLVLPERWVSPGILFPPGLHVSYRTSEFSFEVSTNNLGFRDHDVPAWQLPGSVRVLAVGDSFTYGWGVAVDESWPKVLEQRLRDTGIRARVYNLGLPAAGPGTYAEVVERALPLLTPDLVVIGMLQGDDVMQTPVASETKRPVPESQPGGGDAQGVAGRLYPHVVQVVSKLRLAEEENSRLALKWSRINETFRAQADAVLAQLTPEERARFDRLDGDVRQRFVSGDLNPALVYFALRYPSYFMEPLDPSRALLNDRINAFATRLKHVRSLVEGHRARLLVVSIPYSAYVSRYHWEHLRTIGYLLEPSTLESDVPDTAVAWACTAAGVPFVSVTSKFRDRADLRELYFAWDNHFTAAGHRVFGELIAGEVAGVLRDRASQ